MTIGFTPETNLKGNTRQLKLTPMEGKTTLDAKGMIDKRLFTGDNCLYLSMNPQNIMWTFHYDKGQVPHALLGSWTTFASAFREAKVYFNNRNVECTEVS